MRRTTALSEAFGLDVSGRLVAMYAGGLDGDKRIPFLTEAVRHASSIDPGFLLLVAGSGSEQDLVRSCSNVAWIPHADRAALVDMAAVSQAVWMPGRVGLVAVDAMALGLPILTTSFPFHAPEFEFLTPGVGVHTLPDSPVNFASDAIRLMRRCSRYVAEDLPSINRVADAMMGVLTRVSTQGNTRAVTHPDAESRGGCDGAPAR